ncbi:MAG TPA: hypothetical protein VEV44_01715 [Pseudoneobacillus sp.]|nr:hypothetical protein [Pseudoneobacillus sp.]
MGLCGKKRVLGVIQALFSVGEFVQFVTTAELPTFLTELLRSLTELRSTLTELRPNFTGLSIIL